MNFHAFFTKGTVEFRLFNGTTHAGKMKSYIQFCLAMSAWAIECPNKRLFFKGCKNYTAG
ncbi:amidoligase family protein [Acutalibacter sp.]|uniref:amidoligase family protein n=1 Tax=Acutalibacter sp. TaxID=1918636 RepID=UPI003FA4A9D7